MPKLHSVLLVDDDSTTNYLNRKLILREGITDRILVALNGEEALQILRTEAETGGDLGPALVFLDINMPQMNGFEFLDAFARLPLEQRRSIVIVMLTTSVHPNDMARLEAAPVGGFLNKPLSPEKLRDIVATHFSTL